MRSTGPDNKGPGRSCQSWEPGESDRSVLEKQELIGWYKEMCAASAKETMTYISIREVGS